MLGQKKLFQRLGPGLIHAFIFWGFLVLFPTIVMALIAAVAKGETLPWLGHQGWFALLVDLFVVLVLAGVTAAFWIRKVQRPERFEGSHLGEADLILGLIALIVLTLLLWHAALIAHRPRTSGPPDGRRSPTRSRTSSTTARGPRCESASSSGPTCSSSSASSSTCLVPSTSTSRRRRSTSGSGGRDGVGGSSRSTSRSRTRARCGSARRRSPT